MNFGFSKEDGTGLITFSKIHDSGGTIVHYEIDEIFIERAVTDSKGRVVFVHKVKKLKLFRFFWSAISKAVFENIKTVTAYRRMLFYPDVNNLASEFRVRIPNPRLEIDYIGNAKIATGFQAEEF